MDKIDKALQKLSLKERKIFQKILRQLRAGHFGRLDVQKLKGYNDIYRVRKGDMWIIFRRTDETIRILALERRSSKTYKKAGFK